VKGEDARAAPVGQLSSVQVINHLTRSLPALDIARDLTIWMSAHDLPGRPTKQVRDF
jgi:hypothetical protein